MRQSPDRIDAIAGLAYALIDDGKAGEAVELLEGHHQAMWRDVPLLEAYAEALLAQRELTQALPVYERILGLDPGNRGARRNRIFTVARLGAPHRALELAQAEPGLLSGEEMLSLRSDRVAAATRWGAAGDPDAPGRFEATDSALAQNEELIGQAAPASAAQRRLQFDRIVLLRNRVRMRDCADLYESLAGGGIEVPPYAQVAAADAYLYLREPEKARDLFLQAQARGENGFGAQVGLFYAYSDAEQHKPAITQIDALVAGTPKQINAYSPLTVADNPDYASAVATAGAARGYQDRLCEAQRRLEGFRDLAPWNMEGRERLAAVYAARGWPRRAEQEYLWILGAEPRTPRGAHRRGGHVARVARLGTGATRRRGARRRVSGRSAGATRRAAVEHPPDARAARGGRYRHVERRGGSARCARAPDRKLALFGAVQVRLAGVPAPVRSRRRISRGQGSWHRLGAGAEYRIRDWRASAEINTGYDGDTDVGVTLAGDWSMNDYWNFEAQAESSTNDIPLQGRQSGVHGKSLKLGATYRVSESRRFAASVQTVDFSDGNNREILSGSAFQRLIAGPVFKLDAVLGLYTSRNSLDNANYFNPESDFGADVTLIGEQRLWRRYERSFVHRLYLSLGQYDQKNFGSGPTRGIRYEHEWNFDDRLSLLYGAQRTLHPYDGQGEYANYYNIAVDWKF